MDHLYRLVFNNSFLRNYIYSYTSYFLYYNEEFYQNNDDLNLDDLVNLDDDQLLIIEKLNKFKDIINNSDNSNNVNHTYYQDWLDSSRHTESNYKYFHFKDTENKQIIKDLIEELFIKKAIPKPIYNLGSFTRVGRNKGMEEPVNNNNNDHTVSITTDNTDSNINDDDVDVDDINSKEKIIKIQRDISEINSVEEFNRLYKLYPDYFEYKQVVGNLLINDIFVFSQKIHELSNNDNNIVNILLIQVYKFSICIGNLGFIKYYNELWIDEQSYMHSTHFDAQTYLNNLKLAYWYSKQVYEYLVSFISIIQKNNSSSSATKKMMDEYEVTIYRIAIKKFDISMIKSLYYSWDTDKQKQYLQDKSFDIYYVALAGAFDFKEKRKAIVVGEFLKSEYKEIKYPIAGLCVPLMYLQDKQLCLKYLQTAPKLVTDYFYYHLINGALETRSLGPLKYVITHLTKDEIKLINIEKLIKDYLLLNPMGIKGILYLFQVFADSISIAFLDTLMSMSLYKNNHTLTHILLNRTRVRLIKSKSPQQEQDILDRMKHVCKTSKYQTCSTYFNNYPDFEYSYQGYGQNPFIDPTFAGNYQYLSFRFDLEQTLKDLYKIIYNLHEDI